ncbi:hypothetical protein ACFWSF_24100 [Streptomyces sp. NPDC058611]|uniref:hypothetical protein n=1 Tax=unclassified Streptomyces TaxID=2593676 RepID=UPI003662366D
MLPKLHTTLTRQYLENRLNTPPEPRRANYPPSAPQVLADRLVRRLDEQLRTGGPITDPVGWLIGRGLPQRQQCGDVRCDDRILLDSGQDCPRCEDRQADRRTQRHAVAAAVDAAMPGASEAERRAAADRELHQDVTAQAWIREHRWVQVREQQAAAQARAEAAAAQPAGDVPVAPVAPVVLPAPRPATVVPTPEPGFADADEDQELVLEDLTREQVLDWRNRAAADPSWCSTTSTGTASCRAAPVHPGVCRAGAAPGRPRAPGPRLL